MPPVYQVYFLDAEDRVRHTRALECDDDIAVLTRVQALDWGPNGVEIWQDERLVQRFEAPSPF